MTEIPRKLIIPNERPKSWNDFYSGMHWKARKDYAEMIHGLVRSYLDPNDPIFECRVDILVMVYFDKYPYDPCNIPAKLYIDGLHGWWIKDDTREFVRRETTQSEIDRDNPRIEITATPVEE